MTTWITSKLDGSFMDGIPYSPPSNIKQGECLSESGPSDDKHKSTSTYAGECKKAYNDPDDPFKLILSKGSQQQLSLLYNVDIPTKNGLPYNARIMTDVQEAHTGDEYKAGKVMLKDGAFSLDISRFRKTDGKETKTHEILLKEPEDNESENLIRLIEGDKKVDLNYEERLRMVNDPARRVFESYYAKFALEKAFKDTDTLSEILKLSRNQVKFIEENVLTTEEAKKLFKKIENDMKSFENEKNAMESSKDVKDATILDDCQIQFNALSKRIKKMIKTLDPPPEAETRESIFEIFINHYLTYLLRQNKEITNNLPDGHWDNVFDIVQGAGKGRVEVWVQGGSAVFRQADSYSLGILRNFDPAPQDLIMAHNIEYEKSYQNKLAACYPTRCPDRLEIQDPMHKGASQDGFTKSLYEGGLGTYVNGPSGSIIIELGAMRACKSFYQDITIEMVNKHFETLCCMFIYLEGGHSIDELLYPLKSDRTKKIMQEAFPDKPDISKIGEGFFKDKEILKQAADATRPFLKNLLAKDKVHAVIKTGKADTEFNKV